jgi:hypothetical protein
MEQLVRRLVRLLVERQARQAQLSGNREAEWGSDDHISDLEARAADAAYWKDKHPRGSERRGHYRNILGQLKRELHSANKKKIKLNEKDKIHEGGAAGHLQHLYENLELTFGEIKEVIQNAAEGKLEKATEKLDGMNLVFTYNLSEGSLKAARTGSDIPKGGMDATTLAEKFFGRGNVELAFTTAFKVLDEALSSLSGDLKETIFGPNGNRWYSMEIIYASDPNTINYDSNNIVFHGWPIFELDENGKVVGVDDNDGMDALASSIARMQKSIKTDDWNVRGPSLVNMQKISDGTIVQNALQRIDEIMSTAGVSDNNTVYDYLRELMREHVEELNLPPEITDAVIERAITAPGAPGVPALKKMVPEKQKEMKQIISSFILSSEALLKSMVQPIEQTITDFAVEVLRGIKSTLIDNSDDEVMRLQGQVGKAINAIESSGNQIAMDVLQKEMARLKSVDNVSSAMEGIVFFYKGQAYKFTGAFAPAHQILSLFKYGRKGVPKMDIEESLSRQIMLRLIKEGGDAFDDVEPISLEDLNNTWSSIQDDLTSLGCHDIKMIGSTGKKAISGDVDLAAECDISRDELFDEVSNLYGVDSVRKVGSNIVSIRYPVKTSSGKLTGKFAQVDVMIGKTSYLSWSRFGTTPEKGHKDYSSVKGVVRNMLFSNINRALAGKTFPGIQTDLDRTLYVVDFDLGLFKVSQTKRSKDPSKPLKSWKTLDKEFISDDPEKIVKTMFGKEYNASSLRRFEDVVDAIQTSSVLKPMARQIMAEFLSNIKEFASKRPHAIGENPQETIAYIENIVDNI